MSVKPAADGLRKFRKLLPTRSPLLRDALRAAEKALPTDASILVLGESGTGKDYLVDAIHACSARAAGPLVKIACATLPEELFEAELFGFEKGAFTDAAARKPGRVETAEGGTLYLDEVGALTPHLQAKLLRLLQERTFSRLGGEKSIGLDVRIVSSSNLSAEELSDETRFRRDLYYRLNVIAVRLPPLRERREDIPMLARLFARDAARRYRRRVRDVAADALALLGQHSWPGNVRELRNVIDRAVIGEEGETLSLASLPRDFGIDVESFIGAGAARGDTLEEMERRYVTEVLRRTNGNQSRAALILGISRKTLLEKRKKWGL
ncbi:MAG TPA: sigma-54 dependent transcriptional regulator [Thermoanaerobaculia bacterium]